MCQFGEPTSGTFQRSVISCIDFQNSDQPTSSTFHPKVTCHRNRSISMILPMREESGTWPKFWNFRMCRESNSEQFFLWREFGITVDFRHPKIVELKHAWSFTYTNTHLISLRNPYGLQRWWPGWRASPDHKNHEFWTCVENRILNNFFVGTFWLDFLDL